MRGDAGINQCPPGGNEAARALAALAGVDYAPVDPRFGATKPFAIARIDESACIGCALCIAACPVDAIVGAAKRMHTIIAPACTGCELCIPPCPVDCIEMKVMSVARTADERRSAAAQARSRFERRTARLARDDKQKRAHAKTEERAIDPEIVREAIARAKKRLAERSR